MQGGEGEGGEDEGRKGKNFSNARDRGGGRAVGPAAGEEGERDERDKGAVAVLGVERPFPPVGAEDEEPREGQGRGGPPDGGGGLAEFGGGHD